MGFARPLHGVSLPEPPARSGVRGVRQDVERAAKSPGPCLPLGSPPRAPPSRLGERERPPNNADSQSALRLAQPRPGYAGSRLPSPPPVLRSGPDPIAPGFVR